MLLEYKCQNGQTVFDVALATYGDVSYTYTLINNNSSVIADIDTEITTEMIVQYERLPKPIILLAKEFVNELPTEFSCFESQSIFDVVIQLYGDLDSTYKLIQDSSFTDIDTDLYTGAIAKFEIQKTKIPVYFRDADYIVSNWQKESESFELREDFSFELREGDGYELR